MTKAIQLGFLGALGMLLAASLSSPAAKKKPAVPAAFAKFHNLPSGPMLFLASDEGRAFLRATGHPLANAAIRAFGEPADGTVIPSAWLAAHAAVQSAPAAAPDAVACAGNFGARFNLEPRPNAVPQNQPSGDFLLNRLGANRDLVVEVANDWRGNLAPPVVWDQSVSGYYVHRSTTPDCSTQFEGGLPSFNFQGNVEMGIGNIVVAADPARDTFYAADTRFGSASTGGIALFKATASTLMNTSLCPNGTHVSAQATSCWGATPPVLLFAQSVVGSVGDQPRLAVDERASGTGAGNVYVVSNSYNFNTQVNTVGLVACSSALQCSSAVAISGSYLTAAFPYVHVRADGMILVSMITTNTDGSATVLFVNCAAGGAPNAPVCQPPVAIEQIMHPVVPNFNLVALVNIDLLAFTYPKLATRAENGGGFTTFLVYDDCKNPFSFGNPPIVSCLDSEVLMTTSADGGGTWSVPASIDTSSGHHFYPSIYTDSSTATVNLAYYTTQGDKYNHEVRVVRNQIAPGGTALGSPLTVTKALDPIDGDPQQLGSFQSDAFLGIIARGTGVKGQSHLYTSFDSTSVAGTYEGPPDPEQNNHVSRVVY